MEWILFAIYFVTGLFIFGVGAAILETRDNTISDDYTALFWVSILWPALLWLAIILSPLWVSYIVVLKIRER